ncbi:DUF4010 domain-containing protein [Natronorubrum sp. JWXQ-INN-674]|uniref:DUF4010 domain-containing protein n=1 Tax=Natronorubrum halalkaliphilum TaxID=2691917 RepID=A0A6B0VIX0_9EURY|nr:MgtC/SapB family protein [Natronorubrum halalkaliphilum]MXV60549.1 DUF4010 domain-containing protein [Natronorubrum halalkaliphilum]
MLETEILSSIADEPMQLLMAVAIGMFLGLEREWSQKSAGIRTYALITVTGTVFTILDQPLLLAVGGLLIVVQSMLLGVRGLLENEEGLSLTTSAMMMLAYGIGILIGEGYALEGVLVAVLSSLLLVLKRELHEFAWGLSKDEVQSATELAILAFVIFPFLPDQTIDPWEAINPRTVWLLVIAVSALGFVNYIIMRRYGSKGLAITGFFGGLVNSTAVIGELAGRTRNHSGLSGFVVGAIMLADSAMAFRNFLIIVVFVPDLVFIVGPPLLAITVTGIALSYVLTDWDTEVEAEVESPFSLQNALKFGGLFLCVILLTIVAEETFGASGLIASSFVSGLVSSGSVTTTAVLLVDSEQISYTLGTAAVVIGTAASILVKVTLAASINRKLVRPVLLGSLGLIAAGAVVLLGVIAIV